MSNKPKKSRRKTPFVICDDGEKYIAADAIMNPMVALYDGLPLTTFGRSKRVYLGVDCAIEWIEKEMRPYRTGKPNESSIYGKYVKMLDVLKTFRDIPESEFKDT